MEKVENGTKVVDQVEKVDINLDDLFDLPEILTSESGKTEKKEEKKSIFSSGKADLSFLNEEEEEDSEDSAFKDVLKDVIPDDASLTQDPLIDDGAPEKKAGRSKTDKDGLVELVKKLIEEEKLIPFEDEKDLSEYSMADFQELIEANFNDREQRIKETTPAEFFESLPEELQVAAQYVASGGNDLKGLFRHLAEYQETRELDPANERDQETIVREYLLSTNFGTPEEVEEEIEIWKDRDELGAKALKFKPKLDSRKQQILSQKLAQQEAAKERQKEQAQKYVQTVYDTLKPGELNGLKLDKKTQEVLYSGLINADYKSITGRPTNMFGHLIEKYQYGETPRHDLIAEALWLLSDPEGYKKKIKEVGGSEESVKVARMLKNEQGKASGAGSTIVEKEETTKRKIPRNNNFFKFK